MTSPIPLTDPEGRVWAYLCGNCHHVRGLADVMVDVTEPVEHIVQMSLEQAERCCRCTKCGVPSSWNRRGAFHSSYCEACEAKAKADEPRRRAENEARAAQEEQAFERAIASAKDRDAAVLLRNAMSDASEDVMCAGWMMGLEHILWEELQTPDRKSEWAPYLPEIRRLSEKAGGWWHWADDVGYGIELFVTLAAWQEMYKAHVEGVLATRASIQRLLGVEVGSPTWCAVAAWARDTCITPRLITLASCNDKKDDP